MLKLPDNLSISPGPVPVGKLLPILAVENIGATPQELSARATQFAIGREYSAQIISKADDKAFLVKIDNAVLKMELGNNAYVGQSINLRYVQDGPVPTFLFTAPPSNKATDGTADISSAARLIGQYLQEAEKNGVSGRFEATAIVTNSPKDPQLLAQGLRQAFVNSGLFYESHLSEMVQGNRTLAAIMQEPQNQSQNQTQIATLTSHQLSVLEQSRLNWYGEVWQGQKMQWDVYVEQRDEDAAKHQGEQDAVRPVVSEIKLDFPHLGAVSAKLTIVNGHISINLKAAQNETLDVLKNKSNSLTKAIGDTGLQLEGLVISGYE